MRQEIQGPAQALIDQKVAELDQKAQALGGHLRNNTRKQKQLRWLYSMECVTGLVFF